ncbi:hypothetical protein BZZ01_15970 [Nostocales cyanobacterium HT-58-2]|nr:hypothetical protein BZZ01_15970 [Nostocales cyanobacterium HT-58-2]
MPKITQQRQIASQAVCNDEKLLAAFEEIKLLREQVEFLSELIESQNLHLHHKQHQLQELEQELKATNKELSELVTLECSPQSTFFQAKEIAKTILKSKKSVNKSVAELLTVIYGQQVKPEELQKINRVKTSVWSR